MAAGMGSRFGGVKQIVPVGEHGELIIDYSVSDAIAAGFTRIVFVIRRTLEVDFREAIFDRLQRQSKIRMEYVFQDIDDLPNRFSMPEGRTKPWGTGHAILAARKVIHEPFCVVNSDEFYGRDSFVKIVEFFKSLKQGETGNYAFVTQRLCNVLSDHGTVSRGICETDANGNVTEINERTKVFRNKNGKIGYTLDGNDFHELDADANVNVNFFGFTAEMMQTLEQQFGQFLATMPDPQKSEFYIPTAVSDLIKEKRITLKRLTSNGKWLSVTYIDDLPFVQTEIRKMIKSGEYSSPLWK